MTSRETRGLWAFLEFEDDEAPRFAQSVLQWPGARLTFQMVDVAEVVERVKYLILVFTTSGYKILYKPIFGTPQFPIWFLIQCVHSCYIAHRVFLNKPKTGQTFAKEIFMSFAMVFFPRELFALVFSKLSPILHNPLSIAVFFVVSFAMNFLPFEIFYKVTTTLYSLLGLLMGFNQTRFFTLILRSVKNVSNIQLVPTALFFTVLDQIIEIGLRTLFNGEETNMSNPKTVSRTCIFSCIFWLATHDNWLSPYIGKYHVYIPALLLGLSIGIANGAAVLNRSGYKRERIPSKKLASSSASSKSSRCTTPHRLDGGSS